MIFGRKDDWSFFREAVIEILIVSNCVGISESVRRIFWTNGKLTVVYPPSTVGIVVRAEQVGLVLGLPQQVVEILQADEVVDVVQLDRQVVPNPGLCCRPVGVEGDHSVPHENVAYTIPLQDTYHLKIVEMLFFSLFLF